MCSPSSPKWGPNLLTIPVPLWGPMVNRMPLQRGQSGSSPPTSLPSPVMLGRGAGWRLQAEPGPAGNAQLGLQGIWLGPLLSSWHELQEP